jgi:hypothetical protein
MTTQWVKGSDGHWHILESMVKNINGEVTCKCKCHYIFSSKTIVHTSPAAGGSVCKTCQP